MTLERFNETASTSPDEVWPETDERAGTSLPEDFVSVGLVRPGLFVAGLVLSAALTTGGALGTVSVGNYTARRRDSAGAESGTTAVEIDPVLLKDVRELFEQGSSDFFQDGVHSTFSRTLLKMLAQHGQAAFRAIAEYVFSGNARPDVVSEALRWLADFNDISTIAQRWSILQRTLKDRSPRVRDGAILGFAALDDPRARPLLLEARNLEQIGELRALIDQVIAQLERAR